LKVEFARLAKEQIRLVQASYRADNPPRAKRFAAEIRRVVLLLRQFPRGAPRVNGLRRVLVQRFPYLLLYEVEESRVWIVELVHQKQRPRHWETFD
jgi:toxin ParE1/3/4